MYAIAIKWLMCRHLRFEQMASCKRKNSRADTAAADRAWWNKFRNGLKRLLASKSGCHYCKGSCFKPCHDERWQQHLHNWHEEWALINAEAQDTHLLWTFGGGCNSGGHKGLDDRISTESSDSQHGNGACAEDRIDTSSDQSSANRIPTSDVDTSDSSSKPDLLSSADEHQAAKPRRTYNAGKSRRSQWAIRFLDQMVCKKSSDGFDACWPAQSCQSNGWQAGWPVRPASCPRQNDHKRLAVLVAPLPQRGRRYA